MLFFFFSPFFSFFFFIIITFSPNDLVPLSIRAAPNPASCPITNSPAKVRHIKCKTGTHTHTHAVITTTPTSHDICLAGYMWCGVRSVQSSTYSTLLVPESYHIDHHPTLSNSNSASSPTPTPTTLPPSVMSLGCIPVIPVRRPPPPHAAILVECQITGNVRYHNPIKEMRDSQDKNKRKKNPDRGGNTHHGSLAGRWYSASTRGGGVRVRGACTPC